MMVPGVHSGSAGPLLYLEEELAKAPAGWNGRPVPIQHSEGTCNTPENYENMVDYQRFCEPISN